MIMVHMFNSLSDPRTHSFMSDQLSTLIYRCSCAGKTSLMCRYAEKQTAKHTQHTRTDNRRVTPKYVGFCFHAAHRAWLTNSSSSSSSSIRVARDVPQTIIRLPVRRVSCPSLQQNHEGACVRSCTNPSSLQAKDADGGTKNFGNSILHAAHTAIFRELHTYDTHLPV